MTTSSSANRHQTSDDDAPPNGGQMMAAPSNSAANNALTKTDSEEDAWSSSGHDYINPFVHRVHIDRRIDLAKIYVLTVLLLPIRVFGCLFSLLSAWVFACIGMYGISLEDLRKKPVSGWRKQIQTVVANAMRMLYASASFQYVKIKGERAPPKQAPILVVAPHSSYADSIIVVLAGPPSIVAKQETSEIPLLGKIINFAQPIYVQREDPHSRQNTIREIVQRAHSEDVWPQVVIFSEGTCTNRRALIKFKPGAFYPGVPVQPVLLKYPNKYDTFTWTWDGPGVWRLLWLTFAQFYNRCELEYLPVYTPSEEEKSDANLYARNVREVMARALNIPTSEYSFEDVIMMNRAKEMKVPYPGDIVEIERSLFELGLLKSNRDAELAAEFHNIETKENLDMITFSELLKVDLKDPHFHRLFTLLDHRHIGAVSLKSLLLCSLFCKHQNEEIIHFLRHIKNIYSESSQNISRTNFAKLLRHYGKLSPNKCDALFYAIDQTNKGFILFDDFESYTKNLPEHQLLYKKRETIRRTFKSV